MMQSQSCCVSLVFTVRTPFKIGQVVVLRVTINVVDLIFCFRIWIRNPRKCEHSVYRNGMLLPIRTSQSCSRITLLEINCDVSGLPRTPDGSVLKQPVSWESKAIHFHTSLTNITLKRIPKVMIHQCGKSHMKMNTTFSESINDVHTTILFGMITLSPISSYIFPDLYKRTCGNPKLSRCTYVSVTISHLC